MQPSNGRGHRGSLSARDDGSNHGEGGFLDDSPQDPPGRERRTLATLSATAKDKARGARTEALTLQALGAYLGRRRTRKVLVDEEDPEAAASRPKSVALNCDGRVSREQLRTKRGDRKIRQASRITAMLDEHHVIARSSPERSMS